MNNPLIFFETILGSLPFALTVNVIAFTFKSVILFFLYMRRSISQVIRYSRFYLLMVLIASLIEDSAWILTLSKLLFYPQMDYRISIFWIRIAWCFSPILYQSLALFIESLTEKTYKLKKRHYIALFITALFSLSFLVILVVNINCLSWQNRPPIEFFLMKAVNIYSVFFLSCTSLFFTIRKLRNQNIPHILQKQLRIIIQFLVIPRLISDIVQMYPFNFFPGYFGNSFAIVSISTVLLTTVIFLCVKRIMVLRFLNFENHVQTSGRFNFIDNFKDTLVNFSQATNLRELSHISQTFFKQALEIPTNKASLYFRQQNHITTLKTEIELPKIEHSVEMFLNTEQLELHSYLLNSKILIYDEIDFTNFHDQQSVLSTILSFLESINADVFIPIYKDNTIIAYIIIDRFARINKFYSNVDRDEMIIFASYLGNVINLLQHRNLENLIHQEKELKEELYLKHQEINQYKESIRSFLKLSKHKEIGIIFYKQRRFILGNKSAKELIEIDLNSQDGHSLTKALRHLAQQVEEYKSPQTDITTDVHGNKLIICGMPNLERNNVIITIYYPDITDIILKQVSLLKDPSKWDYLLYLETTKQGQLINKLIPGSNETLLNFKISLLEIALSKKALLIDMAPDDLIPTVELIHHINMRETLHVLKLQGPSKGTEILISLFGVNSLYGIKNSDGNQKPILEKLNSIGTLYIENIHFLDLETQEYLAEFIKYGFYRPYKATQKVTSDVRIICSSSLQLSRLVHEGKFSAALFEELKKTSLSMPSLVSLSELELGEIVQSYAQQAIKSQDFKNLLEITEKDISKLVNTRPASLQEFKKKVQQLLLHKSKKNNITQEIEFDRGYQLTDPDLIQAARLGKYALRDPQIMKMLWNKFRNQNKIAAFLGVNRSSVNRRCKEHNLE